MATTNAFTPMSAGTVSRSVSGTTANVALARADSQVVRVASLAANAVAFIEFGSSTVEAALATGTPILPGTTQLFSVSATMTHMAAIGTAGTLSVTCGQGTNN